MNTYQILLQDSETGKVIEISEIVTRFSIETTIESQPGKCTMQVLNVDGLLLSKGSKVIIRCNDKPIFQGFIFVTTYNNSGIISVILYDSLRYLKNVAAYVLSGKTAEQIFTELCEDFNVQHRIVDNCTWEVSKRIHDNKTIYDIIRFGLDECLIFTNQWFILRDNVGTVELVNLNSLKTNYYIGDLSALTDYTYESSIDSDTYNQIKLVRENKDTANRDVYIVKDSNNIKKWGLLQYYEPVDESMTYEQIEKKASDLLRVKNRETRKMTLNIQGAIFDLRAGNGIIVDISELKNTGFKGKQDFVISKCTHNIEENNETMQIEILNTSLELDQYS